MNFQKTSHDLLWTCCFEASRDQQQVVTASHVFRTYSKRDLKSRFQFHKKKFGRGSDMAGNVLDL
ncbi:hypothetical protein Scep_021610 [Stephania cephalantha]|uniref:Uncharacterized protein n=1 Tax=Stephania cephalantha TaxID=152367 RepID=A0AAP0F3R8_9MAGN